MRRARTKSSRLSRRRTIDDGWHALRLCEGRLVAAGFSLRRDIYTGATSRRRLKPAATRRFAFFEKVQGVPPETPRQSAGVFTESAASSTSTMRGDTNAI